MLIDLGEDWEYPEEPDRPQWAAGWRPLAALIALVPALALTAAAPAPAPAMTVHADLELGPSQELIAFSGNEVIVRDGRAVTVFEPDGRERWKATLTNVQDVFFRVDVDRGRVLAMAQRRQVPRTVAFDLANGARVWEFEGWAEVLDDLIIVDSTDGSSETIYDAHTLTERWSVSGMVAHLVDTDARSLVAIDKEGRITEYELATGAVIRSGRVDLPHAVNYGMSVMGDSIVIFYENLLVEESKMLILDRRALTPRASTSEISSHTQRYDCGAVLCEVGFDAGQVFVFARADGEKLWETRHGAGVMATPAGMFAYPLFEGTSSPPLELLDPQTGRRIASLEGWQPIMRHDRYNRAAPVVLRQVHATGSEGQTFIAGFDRTGLRVLGSLPYVIYSCRYAAWVLACVTGDRRLLVVEINSGRWQA